MYLFLLFERGFALSTIHANPCAELQEIYPGQFTPSTCHRFIHSLELHGKLLRNYTQNIDTLEQSAGITHVVQCHGIYFQSSSFVVEC